jgi:hypothetical protein
MIGQPFYIYKHLYQVKWCYLSQNPNAIHILEKNLDKVDWEYLSANPNAIPILEKNLDKVKWYDLSQNPNSIHILKMNLDKVHWGWLTRNPNAHQLLSSLDYNKMLENMKPFCNELVEKIFHPSRLERICEMYNIEMEDYLELHME